MAKLALDLGPGSCYPGTKVVLIRLAMDQVASSTKGTLWLKAMILIWIAAPPTDRSFCLVGSTEQGPAAVFPYEIRNGRFFDRSTNRPVFLNIICYQPLEPLQGISSAIKYERITDDLRRFRAWCGGSDLLVLRIYPQPSSTLPQRIPKAFYEGLRDLGIWVIRDIYFDPEWWRPYALNKAKECVDLVISELKLADAFDRVFAFEVGNEFVAFGDPAPLEDYLEAVIGYIKQKVRDIGGPGASDWVTWASWPPSDPLYTDGVPVLPRNLDFYSYNVYSYDPQRIRDHQAGPVTGTPYQGYLAALKAWCLDKPVVISETGLPDSQIAVGLDQAKLHPWYPMYRRGALTQDQIAEGLEARFWDARLLGLLDPNLSIAGLGVFEWCDEFHKVGNPERQDDDPEEHFGLATFEQTANAYELRYKLQQDTVRRLYKLNWAGRTNHLMVWSDVNSLAFGSSTWVHVGWYNQPASDVRVIRWETNRGFVIGKGNKAEFYTGANWLGPARITAVALDVDSTVCVASTQIEIGPPGLPSIEIITYGQGSDFGDPGVRASGRVRNVDLDRYKLVVYVKTDKFYVQPYQDLPGRKGVKSVWIRPDGYWWTKVHNAKAIENRLYCWLVPQSFDPPNTVLDRQAVPYVAEAYAIGTTDGPHADTDNDLLPDEWEIRYFGSASSWGCYDDPDKDGADNLEEYLGHSCPVDPADNDQDRDGLMDSWEMRFFLSLQYGGHDDPDADGLDNLTEQALGQHPCRQAADADRDGLPDAWELDRFHDLSCGPHEDPDDNGIVNMDEYQLGLEPTG